MSTSLNAMSNPPGLNQKLDHYASGNDDMEWLPLIPIKFYTVAHIVQDHKVNSSYSYHRLTE